MTRNCLLALILAGVALWMGCARGLQSIATVTVDTNPPNQRIIAVSLPLNFVATINGQASTAVNWSLSSSSCSGNACGTFVTTAQGMTYTAPTTLPSGKKSMTVTVTATSQSDSAAQGQASISILPITVCVTPSPVPFEANTCATNPSTNVGTGLVQQFTAVTIPDNAPQTFAWTCKLASGANCANFAPGANNAGTAVYTANDPTCNSGCVTITATSTLNPTAPSGGTSNVNVLPSRVLTGISPVVPYALRFSGYDTTQNRVLMAGSIQFSTNSGGIASGGTGAVDVVNGPGAASPGAHHYTITAGGYSPSTLTDNSTNDAGTLTFTDSASVTYTFQAVLNSSGEIRLIEADANGSGSGVMQKTAANQFSTGAQNFVFLLSGVDSAGMRAGVAGLLSLDGTATTTKPGNITGGMMDLNDGGTATTFPSVTGTYGPINGNLVPLTLSSPSWTFNAYIGSGETTNGKSPLTLFAVSTDAIIGTQPALAGVMAFQDPGTTYDKTGLASTSAVSHLDGLDSSGSHSQAALVVGSGTADSNDTNGSYAATFDANNAGTLVSSQAFTCTYTTDSSNKGRYVINLLGNSSTCGGTPLPFVFYASGASRGFLLDQSSAAVMVGGMDPQGANLSGTFAPSALPGTYAAATVGDANSSVTPLAANLLLTFLGVNTLNTAGTLYECPTAPCSVVTGGAGNYTLFDTGTGTITLTPPGAANADSFLFYAIDTSQFWMIQTNDATTGNAPASPAVIFTQQ